MALLSEGQVIRGTYEVERYLGEGAFAEVYRVKHRFLGRQAMKVLKAAGMTLAETEEMLSEATLLSRMGHPNIVRVFDANTIETSRGTCGFFTMEYIAGGTLHQFWHSHGNQLMNLETAVELTRQVCRGLAVAHSEDPPIIHRDIKPQNILVGYESEGLRARLSDFGLAKRVNPLTLLASARGTRAFKPPEAFSSAPSDSCAGDIWAMGTTLYLLLTDRLPIPADSSRIPPSRLNVQVDPRLDQIVLRTLAQRPEDRYASAQELLKDLMSWQPVPPGSAKDIEPYLTSKMAINAPQNGLPNEASAREMIKNAKQLARQASKLAEAADLMEEALNTCGSLREEHQHLLSLWRKGIVM